MLRIIVLIVSSFLVACGAASPTVVQAPNEQSVSTNEESVTSPHALETWATASSVLWRSEDERELMLWPASTDWETVLTEEPQYPICIGLARMGDIVECTVPFTDCVHVLNVHPEGAILYVREQSAIGSACTSIESSLGGFARVASSEARAATEKREERPECGALIPENAIRVERDLDGVWLGRTYLGGERDMYQGMFSLTAQVRDARLRLRLDTDRLVDQTECEGPRPGDAWTTLSCRIGGDSPSEGAVPQAPRVSVRVVHGPHHDRMLVRMLDASTGEDGLAWRFGAISLVRIHPLVYTTRSPVCLESDDDVGDVLIRIGGTPDRIRTFIELELASRQRDQESLGVTEASNLYLGIAYSTLLLCGNANQTPRAQELLARIEQTSREEVETRAGLIDELSAAMAPCVERTLARPNFFDEATRANFGGP